ncbi:GNAT family N-acetyltransferase [Nonomuraea sp. NPDC023979]|uniref:GNAT family N-acetyltransferase n=1 Tax=Nonomuraea sp. NPDC023979 TaxID=3154796 RepID=UPI0033D96E7B
MGREDVELRRALEFVRGFARRRAPRVVDVPGGFAVLDDRYPGSYDDNKLVVWAGDDPGVVLEAAERVLGGRGHRQVNVDDDALGAAFAPTFAAAGYEHEETLVMVFRGAPPAGPPEAERLEVAELLPVVRESWRATLPEASEEVVDGLARRIETRLRGADRVGFRGVRAADGGLAAYADLYAHEGVAQIESLVTLARHRGNGHARALMRSLLAETAGADLVFLLADAADWPKDFYARLGFETAGRTHSFLKTP